MRKGVLNLVFCLLLTAGIMSGLFAAPNLFTASQEPLTRNWRLLEQLTMTDSSGTWVNNELKHNHFNYFNPDVVDSTAYSYWDYDLGWTQAWSDHFSYNISQEYITEITSSLVMFSESIPMLRSRYFYDYDNHLVTAVLQISGLDEREWFDVKRVYVTYDNGALNGIMIYDMSDLYNPPTWFKWEFQFDTAGRIVQQLESTSTDSLNWMTSYRTSYLYHGSDTTNSASLIEMISKKFPLYLHFEKPLQIGMLVEKLREFWMYQYWRNDTREMYTYDWMNRMTLWQSQENTMMGDWLDTKLVTYSYDADCNCVTELQQWWSEDPTMWMNESIIYNAWENTTANEDEIVPAGAALQLSVYPNPFKDDLAVSVQSKATAPVKLEIYNSKGQKVHSQAILPNSKVSVAAAFTGKEAKAAGIYFLKAEQAEQSVTRKILHLK